MLRTIWKSRRLRHLAAALVAAAVASGCTAGLYDDSDNWVVRDSDTPEFFAEHDVFYVYPSVRNHLDGKYLNWVQDGIGEEVRRTVSQPLARQFGPRVRLFSPFVPQLGFDDYQKLLESAAKENGIDWMNTPLAAPIEYTAEALGLLLSQKSSEQPLVLLGYGQGALILYEAMKLCTELTPEKGFVAAYLFGIPWITPEKILADFGARGIRPAAGRDDVGVIAVCNILPPGEKLENTFAMVGGAVINPINWRTDATPAPPKEHLGAVFYNHNEINPARRISVRPRFCGAVVDTEHSLVRITHLKPNKDLSLAPRKFKTELPGAFGMCISCNAMDRVRMFKFLVKGLKLPEEK